MKLFNYGKYVLSVSVFLFSSVAVGDEIENLAVKELLEVSGAKKQYDQMIIIMTENMKEGFYKGFISSIDENQMDQEIDSQKTVIFTNKFDLFVEDFKKYMNEEISWDVMVNEVYSPVYLKHLTEDEINEITSFYKSAVGTKFAGISPLLMQDSSKKFNEIYGSKLNEFAIQSAKKRMEEAITELKSLCNEKC
ncbi:MAG: DUF2059 domain-containing protein [Candidatus Thiodiazotropha endolucinida]